MQIQTPLKMSPFPQDTNSSPQPHPQNIRGPSSTKLGKNPACVTKPGKPTVIYSYKERNILPQPQTASYENKFHIQPTIPNIVKSAPTKN